MRSVGFKSGDPWCSLFAKAVWTSVLEGELLKTAKQLMNASSQATFQNFKNNTSGLFKFTRNKPTKGALMVWQSPKNTAKGHMALFAGMENDKFKIIEGNSNNQVNALLIGNPANRKFENEHLNFIGYINIV